MLKGQVVAGEFGKIVMRVKSQERVELGELVVIEDGSEKFLLQVYDLVYGSQISQQNLEMVAGMNLEEGDFSLVDERLRNYQLALLKPVLGISTESRMCKKLPSFFSKVRAIAKEDLSFLTKPVTPLFLGELRSGSAVLDVDLFLPGKDVLSHHVLLPASTGKGKSLDGKESVLVRVSEKTKLVKIGELIDELFCRGKDNVFEENDTSLLDNFEHYEAFSFNHHTGVSEWKPILKFIRHKAPKEMYSVETKSGRQVTVTGDHSLSVLQNGEIKLLETTMINNNDYLPVPLELYSSHSLDFLNLFTFFEDHNVYVFLSSALVDSLDFDKVRKLLLHSRPSQKINDIRKKRKISLKLFKAIFSLAQIENNLDSLSVAGYNENNLFPAKLPLTDDFLRLIGYYLAEGYINNNSVRIINQRPEVLKDIATTTQKVNLHFFYTHDSKSKAINGIAISSSLLADLLMAIGLGNGATHKSLPSFIFDLSNRQISQLLKAYFEGDGSIYLQGKKKSYEISVTSKSKNLISQLSYVLLRFQIPSRVKSSYKRATNSHHLGDIYHTLIISGRRNVQTYLQKIGFVTKGKNISFHYSENTNVDLIPLSPQSFFETRTKLGLSRRELGALCGCSKSMIFAIEKGKRRVSRSLMERVLTAFQQRVQQLNIPLDCLNDVKRLLSLRWDQVKKITKFNYLNDYVYDLSVKDNETFLAGHGGLFVHNSNLMSCILWDIAGKKFAGMLVLDPHDEYYGRSGLGLKDHPIKDNIVYYTPVNPPPGARSLKINLRKLKPDHFQGAIALSDPQRQCFHAYYRKYKEEWIRAVLEEKRIEGVAFHEDTMAVVKRRLISLLGLELEQGMVSSQGIFDLVAGENTINDICHELEEGKVVIVDTSYFSGALEILLGSMITTEIFEKYKYYKKSGQLDLKPIISIVLEEAPRVLGSKVLEQGSNVFESIAREGRKFNIGLFAITQLPSEIPKSILANMNTKIILGIEMNSERQAVMESSAQDLSQDGRTIASLDKGEALVTSTFTRFAVPVKIPLFREFVKKREDKINSYQMDTSLFE